MPDDSWFAFIAAADEHDDWTDPEVWRKANVAVAQDPAGNLKPAKDKSTERIDGIVAIIMAIGRSMVVHEEPQPSYQMFVF